MTEDILLADVRAAFLSIFHIIYVLGAPSFTSTSQANLDSPDSQIIVVAWAGELRKPASIAKLAIERSMSGSFLAVTGLKVLYGRSRRGRAEVQSHKERRTAESTHPRSRVGQRRAGRLQTAKHARYSAAQILPKPPFCMQLCCPSLQASRQTSTSKPPPPLPEDVV
jgi:hypothetical protein